MEQNDSASMFLGVICGSRRLISMGKFLAVGGGAVRLEAHSLCQPGVGEQGRGGKGTAQAGKRRVQTVTVQSIPDELFVYYPSKVTFVLTTNIFQFNLHSIEDQRQKGCG